MYNKMLLLRNLRKNCIKLTRSYSSPIYANLNCIISASGPDRSGIIYDISNNITNIGGNINNSKMSVLGNNFALILDVDFKEEIPKNILQSELNSNLESKKLQIHVHENLVNDNENENENENEPEPDLYKIKKTGRYYSLSIICHDIPGIVNTLTHILKVNNFNIKDMETKSVSAPMAGYPIFEINTIIHNDYAYDDYEMENILQDFAQKYDASIHISESNHIGNNIIHSSIYNIDY